MSWVGERSRKDRRREKTGGGGLLGWTEESKDESPKNILLSGRGRGNKHLDRGKYYEWGGRVQKSIEKEELLSD